MQAMILGIVRHLLTAVGGGLITSGVLGASDLEAAIGAIATLAGIAFSIIAKRRAATTAPRP